MYEFEIIAHFSKRHNKFNRLSYVLQFTVSRINKFSRLLYLKVITVINLKALVKFKDRFVN